MSGREICYNPRCEDYKASHEGMCVMTDSIDRTMAVLGEHSLDKLFGDKFHDRYVEYIKKEVPLGASIALKEPVTCILCGSLVLMPLSHKNWHKRNADL